MNKKQIIEKIIQSKHNKVWLVVTDIDGRALSKLIHRDKFLSALESDGISYSSGIFAIDIAGSMYTNTQICGWHKGFPNTYAQIDLDTFRQIPWNDDIPFFLADLSQQTNDLSQVCPRSLLKRIIQKYTDNHYTPVFSQEYEWFNFIGNPQELQAQQFQNLVPLTQGSDVYSMLRPAMHQNYFNDLFDYLDKFGIPLECLHTEYGPGLYEAAIQHTDALTAADRATLFKTGVKQIAYQHGLTASFMAKVSDMLIGCGGHLHQSIYDDKLEHNVFFDSRNPHNMSGLMQSYIAGQVTCLPEILPMFAPVVNSYKRLHPYSVAPINATWGVDNRTCALRVLSESPESTRIEHRVAGADMNPYLAMSACLASGLYGILNNLTLNTAPIMGNAYEDTQSHPLPTSLQEATERMKHSDISRELFGDVFVEHFVKTREWECEQYNEEEPNWELKRYFELV
ncbi:glutamine synthetase family protein [Candidatus Albibeggiatoa sp. nov. BB20]|uniref:glutamine synthetase family protein n=1 Tax=Candidatus Albibeggiatoa sp. nov. BB20 TaxID=3162723 RepID=UPI0033656FA2